MSDVAPQDHATAPSDDERPRRGHDAALRDHDGSLRDHLANLLRGRGAHVPFERAVADVPPDQRGAIPPGAASSLWQQLEHLRIAQWDILEFSRNPAHVSPEWPAGYWPESALPWSEKADQRAMPGHCFSWSSLSRSDCADSPGAWQRSIDAFLADRTAMIALVANPAADLYRPFPHGTGQTLLREALVVADHNAYHIGQIVLLRRLLGCW